MAHQLENLFKIGQEGFFAVDQLYNGGSRRPEHRPPTCQVSGPNPYKKWCNEPPPTTINSNRTAKKYGGVVVMDGKRE
ncbi:hypothetical protein C2S51_004446 [Perilla frutescens var. frutescens]|nr:hypothetical protein C2S51_004446 [Perilla frutescens var. frutescens]